MANIQEQRICIKLCVANKMACVDAFNMLKKSYGKTAMSKTRVYEWYKLFKEGREEIDDLPRTGRPRTSKTSQNVEKIKTIILENQQLKLTTRSVASALDISVGSAQGILLEAKGKEKTKEKQNKAEYILPTEKLQQIKKQIEKKLKQKTIKKENKQIPASSRKLRKKEKQ